MGEGEGGRRGREKGGESVTFCAECCHHTYPKSPGLREEVKGDSQEGDKGVGGGMVWRHLNKH